MGCRSSPRTVSMTSASLRSVLSMRSAKWRLQRRLVSTNPWATDPSSSKMLGATRGTQVEVMRLVMLNIADVSSPPIVLTSLASTNPWATDPSPKRCWAQHAAPNGEALVSGLWAQTPQFKLSGRTLRSRTGFNISTWCPEKQKQKTIQYTCHVWMFNHRSHHHSV